MPTYREAEFIEEKLDNLYTQDYPKNLMEIVVVDSASNDETVGLVKKWASEHMNVNLKLLEEPERRGMVHALNYALQHCPVNREITLFTDVDAFWDCDALRKIAKYFADFGVGAVTASIIPATQANSPIEGAYRNYYNVLRMAESKIHSTPIHNGALVAFRTILLYKMGGLPNYTGNDDSTPASIIAFMGYRTIQVDEVTVREPIRGQVNRKVRRAQHLLLSFLKTKCYTKKLGLYTFTNPFGKVWKIEWWLHVANPWLLVASVLLFVASVAFYGFVISLALLGMGLLLLMLKAYRTWVLQQVYLTIAALRNLRTKEIMWKK